MKVWQNNASVNMMKLPENMTEKEILWSENILHNDDYHSSESDVYLYSIVFPKPECAHLSTIQINHPSLPLSPLCSLPTQASSSNAALPIQLYA